MSNEVVKREENKIQINNEMSNMLSEEMEGLNISFPIIKVPAGGGLAYEVPGDDPNSPDLQKEFNDFEIMYKNCSKRLIILNSPFSGL